VRAVFAVQNGAKKGKKSGAKGNRDIKNRSLVYLKSYLIVVTNLPRIKRTVYRQRMHGCSKRGLSTEGSETSIFGRGRHQAL
jgi:hypothetical protein